MNVNLSNAVRMFYGKSSYEMVYMEAIANALDAMATEINAGTGGTGTCFTE